MLFLPSPPKMLPRDDSGLFSDVLLLVLWRRPGPSPACLPATDVIKPLPSTKEESKKGNHLGFPGIRDLLLREKVSGKPPMLGKASSDGKTDESLLTHLGFTAH